MSRPSRAVPEGGRRPSRRISGPALARRGRQDESAGYRHGVDTYSVVCLFFSGLLRLGGTLDGVSALLGLRGPGLR